MSGTVKGYSRAQVLLHWSVVVLIVFQYAASDSIVAAWSDHLKGRPPSAAPPAAALLHIAAGLLILLLALTRIALRMTSGAPKPPEDESWFLRFSAEAVHISIYGLLLLLPLLGAAAWFLDIEFAALAHAYLQFVLLGLIAMHVAGALFQHVVRRSGVLMRMFRPEPR